MTPLTVTENYENTEIMPNSIYSILQQLLLAVQKLVPMTKIQQWSSTGCSRLHSCSQLWSLDSGLLGLEPSYLSQDPMLNARTRTLEHSAFSQIPSSTDSRLDDRTYALDPHGKPRLHRHTRHVSLHPVQKGSHKRVPGYLPVSSEAASYVPRIS